MVFRYLVMAWPNLYNSVLKITTYFYFIIILLFFRGILLSSLANITLPGQNIDNFKIRLDQPKVTLGGVKWKK